MAKRLTIDGYGQIEINNCAFRRDGRIEAQCKPDATDFSDVAVENGMLLTVDNVKRTVKFGFDANLPVALTYSAEHIYDERTPGLKNFKLNGKDDFLPRLGYLAVGDKWTENCVCYDSAVDSDWTDDSAFVEAMEGLSEDEAAPIYGGISDEGAILVSATAPTQGPVLRVVKATTMPDGSFGLKFQCIKE